MDVRRVITHVVVVHKNLRTFHQIERGRRSFILAGSIFDTQFLFATFLGQYGAYEEAQDIFEQLLRNFISDSIHVKVTPVQIRIQLAIVLVHQAEFSSAWNVTEEALDFLRGEITGLTPEIFQSFSRLARLLNLSDEPQKAEKLTLELIDTARERFGKVHPLSIEIEWQHELSLQLQHNPYEAQNLLRSLLDRQEQEFGDENLNVYAIVYSLAKLDLRQGKLETAKALATRAAFGTQKILGKSNLQSLSTLKTLVNILRSQGQLKEAEPLALDVWKGRDYLLGSNHPDTITDLDNYIQILYDLGQYGEAERLRALGDSFAKRIYSISGSVAQSNGSDTSTAVGSSGTSSNSTLITQSARELVLLIFADDASLQNLYEDAFKKSELGKRVFVNTFTRLLKSFCLEVKPPTGNLKIEQAIAVIRNQRRWITSQIRHRFEPITYVQHDLYKSVIKQIEDKIPTMERYLASLPNVALPNKVETPRTVETSIEISKPSISPQQTNTGHIMPEKPRNFRWHPQRQNSPLSEEQHTAQSSSHDLAKFELGSTATSEMSSNDEMGYPDFPNFDEIQSFLVRSDAFHNLQKNLRHLLYPYEVEDKKLRAVLFDFTPGDVAGSSLLARAVQNFIAIMITALLIVMVVSLSSSLALFTHMSKLLLYGSLLSPGLIRLEWVCVSSSYTY